MLNRTFLLLTAFFLLSLALPEPSFAARKEKRQRLPALNQTLSRKERCAFTLTLVNENSFTVDRNLNQYVSHLGNAFKQRLIELSKRVGAHWINFGAGNAVAESEFLKRVSQIGIMGGGLNMDDLSKPKMQVTSVGVVAPPWAENLEGKGQYRYFKGFVEKLPLEKIGKAEVITDLYGPLSYSSAPDVVIASYFKLLKPGGEIYIFGSLGWVETGRNEGMSFEDFLGQIPGVRVEADGSGLKVTCSRKTPPRIPKLKIVDTIIRPNPPPWRQFKVID